MSSFHKGTSSVHLYFSTLMYILVVQNISLVKIKLLGGEATVPGEKKNTKNYEKDMGITWKRKKMVSKEFWRERGTKRDQVMSVPQQWKWYL